MAGEKWVLCECESYFNYELYQSMRKVVGLLQVFGNKDSAEHALDMFNDFYDHERELAVVREDKLNEHFR